MVRTKKRVSRVKYRRCNRGVKRNKGNNEVGREVREGVDGKSREKEGRTEGVKEKQERTY